MKNTILLLALILTVSCSKSVMDEEWATPELSFMDFDEEYGEPITVLRSDCTYTLKVSIRPTKTKYKLVVTCGSSTIIKKWSEATFLTQAETEEKLTGFYLDGTSLPLDVVQQLAAGIAKLKIMSEDY